MSEVNPSNIGLTDDDIELICGPLLPDDDKPLTPEEVIQTLRILGQLRSGAEFLQFPAEVKKDTQ